jgi:hypothetical protein
LRVLCSPVPSCWLHALRIMTRFLHLQNDGTFYLIDDVPKFSKYMSEPIKTQQSSSPLDTPGYFVAGIVKGYLVSSGFPAECGLVCLLAAGTGCVMISIHRMGRGTSQFLSAIDAERFSCACSVDAAWKLQQTEPYKRSVIIIKFSKSAMARERRYQR